MNAYARLNMEPVSPPDRQTECKPYISVVVSAYFKRPYLSSALRSTLQQEGPLSPYEVIVLSSENCSSEIETIASLSREGVTVTQAILTTQPSSAFLAEGISRARGEVIVFLDDDDVLASNKLSTIEAMFRANKRLGYVHNAYQSIDSNGLVRKRATTSLRFPLLYNNKPFRVPPNPTPSQVTWIGRSSIDFNSSSISIRRSTVMPYLKHMVESDMGPEIIPFYSSLLSGSEVASTSDPLTYYRIHPDNKSNQQNMRTFTQRLLVTLYKAETMARQARNQTVMNLVEREVAYTQILVNLQGGKERSPMAKNVAALLPLVRYYNPFLNLTALLLASLFLLSPSTARQLYFFFHRWALS